MILANHEVNYNLRKFIDLGGKLKDVLSFDDFRIVMYSPWKKIKNKLQIRITREDLTYFEENLSKNNENIVFITDMLHHNNVDFKGDLDWENITTILKKFNVKYVIVGDNDHVGHSYSWISLKDIKYIHTGVAHNFYNPNINNFIEVQFYADKSIKFVLHTINYNALSDLYKLNKFNFINHEDRCEYSEIFNIPLTFKRRFYCKIIRLKDVYNNLN